MILKIRDIEIEIKNFSDESYESVKEQLITDLANEDVKNREVIQNAFAAAVSLGPSANPSDLWHQVVYRLYREELPNYRSVESVMQSWARASGDAFETFHAAYYNTMLAETDVRLIPLLSKKTRIDALQRLGIYGKVGDSKLDTLIVKGCAQGMEPTIDLEPIGGVHLKVSLAERVSDDVPCSQEMMKRGFLSILATLDVKSFPKSATISDARAFINYGELGSPATPTDKRKYIESHGSFDAAFSYNSRTVPSPAQTASGKMIYTQDFSGAQDEFYKMVVAKASNS